MTLLLTPREVPRFWEVIKKAVQEANKEEIAEWRTYANELLFALLNSKAQCFVRLDEDRILEAIAITRVLFDNRKMQSYLYVQTLYSWQIQSDDVWQRDIVFMRKFAKDRGCSYIGCQSSNPGAWKIFKYIGMNETTRIFSMEV